MHNSNLIQFDFYKNPSKAVENKGAEYHVRINNNVTINMKTLIERLQRETTVTDVDIVAVLTGVKTIITDELSHGNVVSLDGICKLEPILGKRNGYINGKENGSEIEIKNVRVRPYKSLVKEIRDKQKPCSLNRVKHSATLDDTQIEERLTQYFKENDYINRQQIENLFGLTRYKATILLKQLVEEKKLIHPGNSKDSLYYPAKGHYVEQENA